MAESPSKTLKAIGGFELITKIGQGGMGTVFKARQVSLDRVVALKVLPPSIAKDAKFIERFQREARASAKLNHRHIVQGIDVGQDAATGLWYFAMEYVDGPTLKDVLSKEGPLTEARALEIAKEIADALQCAAAQGIVHRDIKPDNILLTSRGEAKLADLGLAKHVSDNAAVTQSGQAVGTPFYMAPEQARGALNEIDARTDLYALGATLFHLLTGQPPFNGPTSAAIMVMHLTEKPPLAHKVKPGVSEACGRLIERLMQKDKAKRVQSPKELEEQIEKIQRQKTVDAPGERVTAQQRPVTAARSPVSARAPQTRSRREQFPAALIGIGAAVVLGLVLLLAFSGKKPPRNDGAENKALAGAEKNRKEPASKPAPAKSAQAVQPKAKVEPRVSTPAPIPVAPAVVESKTPEVAVAPDTATPPPAPPPDSAAATPGEKATATPAPPPDTAAAVPPPDTAAPAAQPAGPDPAIQAAYGKFLSELTRRSAREMKELVKVLPEMRELAAKPEFAPAKDLVAQELKDLERAIGFESKAMQSLAAGKGDLDLPPDLSKLASGAKKAKIARYDSARGIFVNIHGGEFPVSSAKLAPKTVVAGAGSSFDAVAAADFYAARGASDDARALLPALPKEELPRMERKLAALKSGDAEGAAQDAYKEILALIRTKKWKELGPKISNYVAAHGATELGTAKVPELAAFKEFAEIASAPPTMKPFHAKSGRLMPDGFFQLYYDFSTGDQIQDFACDHGDLTLESGWLKVPPGGSEYAQARFIAPVAELRTLEVTGKMRNLSRMSVSVISPGSDTTDLNFAPKCICRPGNMRAYLEVWDNIAVRGNAIIGTKDLDWTSDTNFQVEAAGASWTWTVGGREVGAVKLPASAVNGRLAFTAVNGDHSWRNLKIVFKPDAAWLAKQK